MLRTRVYRAFSVTVAIIAMGSASHAQRGTAGNTADSYPRLYVLEGGILDSDPGAYEMTIEEVESAALSLSAYLIVHPQGVLIWETGAISDDERISADTGVEQVVVRTDLKERHVKLGPPLLAQLAEIGYEPADVTHLALSHYHWDHTANANSFAHANWLVRPTERDTMFADVPGGSARPQTYASLKSSRTILIGTDEHDVFGDGTVILKAAPGHSPGHQVLYVNLVHTGGIVLSGDLYHYKEERSLNRLPINEFDKPQTIASRKAVDEFVSRTGAELWIQHDLTAHRDLKKAPAYYD